MNTAQMHSLAIKRAEELGTKLAEYANKNVGKNLTRLVNKDRKKLIAEFGVCTQAMYTAHAHAFIKNYAQGEYHARNAYYPRGNRVSTGRDDP